VNVEYINPFIEATLNVLKTMSRTEAIPGKPYLKKDQKALGDVSAVIGLELLKAVKTEEKFKDVPFIMLTAEGQKDCVIEAVKAGVTNFIVKPFTPDTLKEKLNAVFS